MNISDPIGDMLTRIRNACKAEHPAVEMPASKVKSAIAEVLKTNGFIHEYQVEGDVKKHLTISLKYNQGRPVIEGLERVSKPSCRIYVPTEDIPRVMGGLGIAVLSTSKGVMTDREARREKIGGEVLCYIW